MELLHCRIIPPQWACAALSSTPSSRFSALHCTAFNLNSCLCLRSSWLHTRRQKRRGRHLAVRALELDQDTLVAVAVGVVSIGVGIAIPVFYESQINNAATRENDQPCFPCKGTGAQTCRFCLGEGSINVELGGGETEVSKCINCEGAGSLTCTTCQGTGIQPRYLDRREFKDDD